MMQHQVGPNYVAGASRVASDIAMCHARALANASASPVGIWHRDGWLAVSDVAPDIDDNDTRDADGWSVWAVVDPDWVEW